MGWTEAEAKAAVEAYFSLLDAEQKGETINKAALYRQLSTRFPSRSTKAFELKFQNISAILYEQHLPYCAGLKPRSNYQRLLKLLVLDHLDRSPLPLIQPYEILFSKLSDLIKRGPIRVTKKGTGRFGLAVEESLGITPNSDKAPDFMGIELKTKGGNTLQTLFSRTPSRYVQDRDKKSMFDRHHYFDTKKNRRALYTSFTSVPDSLGFSLLVDALVIKIMRYDEVVLEYDAERLEEALLSKHSQTAFMEISTKVQDGIESLVIKNVAYCRSPSIIKFMRLIREGKVFQDFTMSDKEGRIKDHGFLWRIESSSLPDLYLSTEILDIDTA